MERREGMGKMIFRIDDNSMLASSGVAEGESETNLQNVDGDRAPSVAYGRCSDDWLCSICMDFLMDAVKTECSHKFCRFCIARWINVNPGRRCPICRSEIGTICSLPELDQTIANFLQENMTPEELLQRQSVTAQRELLQRQSVTEGSRLSASRMANIDMEDYFETQDSMSLETQLVSNALRNSIQAAEHEYQLRNVRFLESMHVPDSFFQNHDNPWNAQSTAHIINRLRQSIERLQEFQFQDPFDSLNTVQRPTDDDEEVAQLMNQNENPRQSTQQIDRRFSGMSSSRMSHISQAFGYSRRGRRQAHMRAKIEDDLIEEYNYHARRIDSAYTRIQEAQRDYDFHTDELTTIYEEFVSNQTGRMNHIAHRYDPDLEEYSRHSQGLRRRGRSRLQTPESLRSSRLASNDSLENGGTDFPDLVQLRRTTNRSHSEHPHRPFPCSLRHRRNHSRYHRLDTASVLGSDPSTVLLATTPSESVGERNSQQPLRVTREEVDLPQGYRIDQDQGSHSFRSILSARSPLRTWSEFSRERCPNTGSTRAGSRQWRRRSVQFQTHRHSNNETPDHEVSTPNANAEDGQPELIRNNYGSNSSPVRRYQIDDGPTIPNPLRTSILARVRSNPAPGSAINGRRDLRSQLSDNKLNNNN